MTFNLTVRIILLATIFIKPSSMQLVAKAFAASASKATCSNSIKKMSSSTSSPLIRVIPNDKLYTSEPDPRMFGNGANPFNNENWTNGNWLLSRFHFSFAE